MDLTLLAVQIQEVVDVVLGHALVLHGILGELQDVVVRVREVILDVWLITGIPN